jgi:anti-anti-sigma factor
MADAPLFTVQASFRGTAAEVTVRGDLDAATAPRLAEILTLALDKQPATLVLDLPGVDFLACAAAGVIAAAARALPAGHQVILRSPARIVRRLLQLTGLQEIVAIQDGASQPDPPPLTVTAARDGRSCLLTLAGDLDITAAAGLAAQVAQAAGHLSGHPGPLVLDLAGLTFLDVAGARALHAVTAAAPPGRPVIIRAVSPAATRLLHLLGLNLERPHPAAPAAAEPGEQLAQQAQAARAQLVGLRDTAFRITRTERQLARPS